MAGGVSRFSTAAGPSGGRKRKGETPRGGFGTSSEVSCPSRQAKETVERCCSCTRHSTCSTTGLSAQACKCRNAGHQCTGCYCWGKCCNKGRLMPSPRTMRGLLGNFPRGADLPGNNPHATTPPVRLPISFPLWKISVAGARGKSARKGASSCKGPRKDGRSGVRGEAKSEKWSGRSDNASNVESEEGGRRHDTLMVSPWGTQKIGARGLRVDARAGGSNGRKAPSAAADDGGT